MADEPAKKDDKPDDTPHVAQEHFWFTLTSVTINAFLMSTDTPLWFRWVALAASTLVSAHAVFLIVERGGAPYVPSEKFNRDQVPKEWDKYTTIIEEKRHLSRENRRLFWRRVRFVWVECSGCLFYLCLVFYSWVGVILISAAKLLACDHPPPE
jgi:hypothetical protein